VNNMEKYFDNLILRFNKIADIPIKEDEGKLMLRKDDVIAIIEDERNDYRKNLWKQLWKNDYPFCKYGEVSRLVLVKYKDQSVNTVVCTYDFITRKFMLSDQDITDKVKEWCEVPGHEYDE